MNKPSRTDEPQKGDGYNQSPNELSNDLTTNQDLNGISNSRTQRRGDEGPSIQSSGQDPYLDGLSQLRDPEGGQRMPAKDGAAAGSLVVDRQAREGPFELGPGVPPSDDDGDGQRSALRRARNAVFTFIRFIGPGFMVAVSYST